MKLGVISDIHLDVNEQYPVVELLAKEAERRKLEGLLLAGDISNGPKSTLRHLEQMKKGFRYHSGSYPAIMTCGTRNRSIWTHGKYMKNIKI